MSNPGSKHASTLEVAHDGDVLRVTITRPEKLNALSRAVLEELRQAFAEHAGDDGLRLAVLRGAGNRSFAAGGDLRDLASVRTLEETTEMATRAKAALDAIRDFPVPVIAALNGNAMGGGAELAVSCDFRVAARHARIGFVQGRLDISTAWGGGVDLMQLVGPSRALGLLCRAEMLDGETALGLGLVDRVAEDGQSLDECLEVFAAPFLRQKPQVLRAFKALAREARRGATRSELDALETRNFAAAWIHDDHWAAADKVLAKRD
jgi:enoyl-CoA hydratase